MAEDRVGGAMSLPFLPREIGIVQPTLIDVDDPLALCQELDHLLGEHHTEDQTLLRIGIIRYALDPLVFEPEILSENSGHQLRLYEQLTIGLNQLHHLLDVVDDGVLPQQLFSLFSYG